MSWYRANAHFQSVYRSQYIFHYPVDISTTAFSYSHAMQYHMLLHGTGGVNECVLLHGTGGVNACYCMGAM